jgi:hypothetical protein
MSARSSFVAASAAFLLSTIPARAQPAPDTAAHDASSRPEPLESAPHRGGHPSGRLSLDDTLAQAIGNYPELAAAEQRNQAASQRPVQEGPLVGLPLSAFTQWSGAAVREPSVSSNRGHSTGGNRALSKSSGRHWGCPGTFA